MNSILKLTKTILLSTLLLVFVFAGNQIISAQSAYAITENSVGSVRLGMTVAQARRALRGYTLRRSSDGEGIALIDVRRLNRTYMTLYAGEEDPGKPINNRAKIEQIEVVNSRFRTPKGVYPGMRVNLAERVYGKVREIMTSEIESREYATFTNQPDHFIFQLRANGSTAGVYPRGQMRTIRAASNAFIYSITISEVSNNMGGNGNVDNSTAGFSSQYTDFSKDCNTPTKQNDESGHISSFCKGYGEYRVHIFDTATTLEINAETDKEQEIFHITSESLNYNIDRQKVEWRMANGKPFAVIMQGNKYQTANNGLIAYPQRAVGSHYVVKGLKGFEEINYTVEINRGSDDIVKARQMADAAYIEKNPSTGSGGGNVGGGNSNTAFQNVDINKINQTIDQASRRGNKWVNSPMQVLTRLISDFSEMKNRTIEMTSPTGEGADEIMLTVTNSGLLDDSIQAEKYMYKLEKTSRGVWKVTTGQKSWQCQQNRGHQNFSAVPCN